MATKKKGVIKGTADAEVAKADGTVEPAAGASARIACPAKGLCREGKDCPRGEFCRFGRLK